MIAMSLAANRPLNWNVLGVAAYAPKGSEAQLAASDYAAARGATVIALTPSQVMKLRINLATGFLFDALPGWAAVLGLRDALFPGALLHLGAVLRDNLLPFLGRCGIVHLLDHRAALFLRHDLRAGAIPCSAAAHSAVPPAARHAVLGALGALLHARHRAMLHATLHVRAHAAAHLPGLGISGGRCDAEAQ